MISELERKSLKIGFKEVMSNLTQNRVERIMIANDCDDKIKIPVFEMAEKAGLKPEFVETMRELGKACGIDVGASCAAILKF